jgi:hypothetical protein
MRWLLADEESPAARRLADRHYSRVTPGARKIMPPGRRKPVVLITADHRAVWVTVHPRYAQREWLRGAWVNSLFRNEGAGLSSELILEAIAATRYMWGDPPPEGMLTLVRPSAVRHKRDPGRCYAKAGIIKYGIAASDDVIFRILPEAMPLAEGPIGGTERLFEASA